MTGGSRTYDVAILGSGMAGTILGSILARHGVEVLILESKSHPRFAIGESTIPHTSLLISILAARHDVPEIDHIAYPDRILKHVCTTCGIKRSFGFAYHREGERYDSRHGLQFGTSSKDENHFFRQDIDEYLLRVAMRYGATYRDRVGDVAVDISPRGAEITTARGDTFKARYVVDGSGYGSVLAAQYGLRESPTRLRHHARTLFTHMIDVKRFEEDSPLTLPWEQSTLHHVFERGWFWVIPFNNQQGSTNPLVSVGLTVDPRRYPKPDMAPEAEFERFLKRFPSVAEQFDGARAVRPWVSTGRLQYSSTRCTGYRYCLMSHAAGFVDPLFSRGIINTIELIYGLVDPLLAALDDNDFSEQRFSHLDELQSRVLDYNDRLVNGSFISWDDFDLWNAWLRVWALGTILTEFRLMNILTDFSSSGDLSHLDCKLDRPAFSDFEGPEYGEFFERVAPLPEEVEAGRIAPAEAADRIYKASEDYEFPVEIRLDSMKRADWVGEKRKISPRSIAIAQKGYRWAITNPDSRDLYGTSETFYRWRDKRPDPHLAVPETAAGTLPSSDRD